MAQDRLEQRRRQFQTDFHTDPSDATLALMDSAEAEARKFSHNYIGSEHLLLGASVNEQTKPSLQAVGLKADKIRSAVEFIIGRGDRHLAKDEVIRPTPRTNAILEASAGEQHILNDPQLEPDHIILSLVRHGEGIGIGIVESLGVSGERLRSSVLLQREARQAIADYTPESPKKGRLQGLPTAMAVGIAVGLTGVVAQAVYKKFRA